LSFCLVKLAGIYGYNEQKIFFMNKNGKIHSTTIRVHPAVFRHIDNTFNKVGNAYDLRGHLLYNFISVGLSRSSVKVASMLPLQYEKMQQIKVVISSWDYNHYGWEIPPIHQVALSNHIYKQILFDACYRIMICHVFGSLPRDTAIKEYLWEHCFEESELNYPALRKHYQRHWLETEKIAKANVAEFNTNSTHCLPEKKTKKNVGIVPFRLT
jgi:hypothetical protein